MQVLRRVIIMCQGSYKSVSPVLYALPFVNSVFLEFNSRLCVLQPVSVDDNGIYVPVLVEGDGLLQRFGVVTRSCLKYQEQVILSLCARVCVCVLVVCARVTQYPVSKACINHKAVRPFQPEEEYKEAEHLLTLGRKIRS